MIVRDAREKDIPDVMLLIGELAEHHHNANELSVTEDDFSGQCFSP